MVSGDTSNQYVDTVGITICTRETARRSPTEVNHLLDEGALSNDLFADILEGMALFEDEGVLTAPVSSREKGYEVS